MERNQFRVGTFNLNNLMLPDREFYPGEVHSQVNYLKKLTWIGAQLDRMKVDICGFQEVFHRGALKEALHRSEYHQQHEVVMAEGFGRGPGVALATRFPVLGQRMYDNFPPESVLDLEGAEIPIRRFSHPVLAVDLALTETIHCTVFVVHLKSKRPMMTNGVDRSDPVEIAKGHARSLIRRTAEAAALRFLLMEGLRDRRYPVIVMGDVNDNHTAVTTQIVTGHPPWESWPYRKKAPVWDVLLYQVKDIQARLGYGDHYYTYIHNGHYDSLDHIMVSEEFSAQNRDRIGRVTYVSVFNDHLFDQTLLDETIEPWQSDHGQVVATIELNPPQSAHPQLVV
ncbi:MULTISPECIES: endonuclease/exonuclease/phosphatase family protein [Cyanophyceae]|uniref:Endonuclease/exonuclease/phosphatase family protein n=1 Tax=Leptolyngbya subtilissima DQ-A4 TaxID=2933933 RepID=A0ABV0K1A0_9CYAN|nr:endonuclease/exonuclease/phosphatase family protein [Nodosilinea sp. FACHB-141]MBD2111330.1 endonuclease/exonuclease/phosphatase family protein [Nodosilinea sp. FACHB-141]